MISEDVNQAAILQKEEMLMATAALAATLNAPISELRPVPIKCILVIEDDGASREILRRLFASEGMRSMLSPMALGGLEMIRQRVPGRSDPRSTAAAVFDLRADCTK